MDDIIHRFVFFNNRLSLSRLEAKRFKLKITDATRFISCRCASYMVRESSGWNTSQLGNGQTKLFPSYQNKLQQLKMHCFFPLSCSISNVS